MLNQIIKKIYELEIKAKIFRKYVKKDKEN